jgi:SAM-dependent methyltransferase
VIRAVIRRFADRLAETPAAFHWLRKLPEGNYRETKRRIAAVRDGLGAPRVLDLGCGAGEYAELFDPAHYLGMDIDAGYIEFARSRHPKHSFACADVTTWSGEAGGFDLVLVNGVLHHLADAEATSFLRNAHRLTRPGGTLLVIEDVRLEPPSFAARVVHFLDYGDHIRTLPRWQALVSAVTPIARSETYVSGICPYHLMLCPKPAR